MKILETLKAFTTALEKSCCKKLQKIPGQETGLGNRESLKVLNDTKLVLKSFMINLVQNSQTSRNPRINFLTWTFFAASYSKTALVLSFPFDI